MKVFAVTTIIFWVASIGMAIWGIADGYPERQIFVAMVLIKGLGAPVFSFLDVGAIQDAMESMGLRSPLLFFTTIIAVLWTAYILLPAIIVFLIRAWQRTSTTV
jgi:hypothetical protein